MTTTTPRNIALTESVRSQLKHLYRPDDSPWVYLGAVQASGMPFGHPEPIPSDSAVGYLIVYMQPMSLIFHGRAGNRELQVYVGQSVKSGTVYWAVRERH